MGPALFVSLLASHQLDPRHMKTPRASILPLKNIIQIWLGTNLRNLHVFNSQPLTLISLTFFPSLTEVGLSAHTVLAARLLFDTQEGFNCFLYTLTAV